MTDDPATELRIAIAELRSTVLALKATVELLPAQMVSKDAFEALKGVVADVGKGVERNDERWARVAWFVALAVLGALLGLVLVKNGGTP